VNVLLRNALGALRDGGTSWYMDWFGANWYRDAELMESIAATQRLARERLGFDNSSIAQIAVFVSDRRPVFLARQRPDRRLVIRQLPEIWRIGAPVDVYDAADLGLLFSRPESARYRLLIFLDLLAQPTPSARLSAHAPPPQAAFCSGATHPGCARNPVGHHPDPSGGGSPSWEGCGWVVGRLSLDGVTALTGIRVKDGPPGDFGVSLIADDPAATELAPGLWQRQFPTHTAVWHSSPLVPAAVLRNLAGQAGVHIYCSAGDQVMAEKNLLAIHAAHDGPRQVRLPAACRSRTP